MQKNWVSGIGAVMNGAVMKSNNYMEAFIEHCLVWRQLLKSQNSKIPCSSSLNLSSFEI